MPPHDEEQTRAIRALEHTVTEIRTTLNNGLKTMVQEQKTELVTVKDDIQRIRDALTSHVAKEDVVYEIFKRVMNTGVRSPVSSWPTTGSRSSGRYRTWCDFTSPTVCGRWSRRRSGPSSAGF